MFEKIWAFHHVTKQGPEPLKGLDIDEVGHPVYKTRSIAVDPDDNNFVLVTEGLETRISKESLQKEDAVILSQKQALVDAMNAPAPDNSAAIAELDSQRNELKNVI